MPKSIVSSDTVKNVILVLLKRKKNKFICNKTKLRILKLFALYQQAVEYEKNNKRMWVSEKFAEEERLAHGMHANLMPILRTRDQEYFFRLMRMSPDTFDLLLSYVGPRIAPEKGVRMPIWERERLELVLFYLATGSFQHVVGLQFRISEAATHNFIYKVCDAIWDVLQPVVFEQPSEQMWRRVAQEFEDLWQFPNCLGAIDGKLIQMECPAGTGLKFRDYKVHFSTNFMAITGAKQEFIMVDIGAPGRHSDGGVFAHSEMGQRFMNGSMSVPQAEFIRNSTEKFPYVLVGDEAFALSPFLMRPYPRRNELNLKKRVFNYRLSRARRIVETSFGILSAVWRIFKSPLRTHLETNIRIIKACACLHNFILKFEPQRQKVIKMASDRDAFENCFTDLLPDPEEVPATGVAKIRENFANYFMTAGAVEFQWARAINADF